MLHNALKHLSLANLAEETTLDGQTVSVYYKHFTQASDDPLYAPKAGCVE